MMKRCLVVRAAFLSHWGMLTLAVVAVGICCATACLGSGMSVQGDLRVDETLVERIYGGQCPNQYTVLDTVDQCVRNPTCTWSWWGGCDASTSCVTCPPAPNQKVMQGGNTQQNLTSGPQNCPMGFQQICPTSRPCTCGGVSINVACATRTVYTSSSCGSP
jgi:hypothetical protein